MTVFLRLVASAPEQKADELLRAIGSLRAGTPVATGYAERSPQTFASIPGSPFAYWTSREVLETFRKYPSVESAGRHAAAGASTKDNLRFVRTLWEVNPSHVGGPAEAHAAWVPLAKGGAHARYYADVHLAVRWANDGRELKVAAGAWRAAKGWGDHWKAELHNSEYYGRPGVTWPVRSQKGFSARALGSGAIFGHKGPTVFIPEDQRTRLLALLAVMNSQLFEHLVSLQMAFGAYEVGVIQRTPLPELPDSLGVLGRRAWRLRRALDTTHETSGAFVLPRNLIEKLSGIDPGAVESELALLQRQIDSAALALYGLGEDACTVSGPTESLDADEIAPNDVDDDSEDDEEPAGVGTDALCSWLTGVIFGRFDPRLATGERAIPPEPEPFGPLPSRSPGMYPEGEEPAERPDILVDDEGHLDDLAARAQAVAERLNASVPENLRSWLAKEFFPLHIKMYSKSRRKAPIYWQLATPSASYSVWLYIHAFSTDTLFRVQNDYVGSDRGKLAHEERRLEAIRNELREGATAAQRKALAAQEELVEELRAFLDEVKRVAPLWRPNLDDGVIINFAPLWRLVPQNKAWQKELKATWDALCDGKYDWAHLSMHLWPERVVPKCAKDRSLAIAHGLEDLFWVEGSDGKWTPRKLPIRPIDDLIKERTSAAVKSALKSLLEAPVANSRSAGRKVGGRRKAAAAADGGDG